jgi:hypothetical protein
MVIIDPINSSVNAIYYLNEMKAIEYLTADNNKII